MDEQNWFRDKVALVTGASSGIGRATALTLGSRGARVGVNYFSNQDAAEAVCREIVEAGGEATAIQADVGTTADIDRMFAELDAFGDGRIDLLVNNAGQWMDREYLLELTEDHWDRIQDVNLKSVFLCCQHAAKRMIDRGEGGGIVNIGSIVGHTGGSGGTLPYVAAKAGVHVFTHGLARELAPHNIRVNCVSPGFADTPMLEGRVSHERAQQTTPLGRMAEPQEIANVIVMLLSPMCSFVAGQVIDVNGGLLMR